MTYGDLIVALADLTKELPPTSTKLLIHLIATGITDGSNEVRASIYTLAKDTRMSRDTVRKAAEALKAVVRVTLHDRVGYSFHLQPDWFEEGRGLFTELARVEKLPASPGNQATASLETRRQQPDFDQSRRLETRRQDADVAWEPGDMSARNQATEEIRRLETRRQETQNQQLTGGDACRSIDLCISEDSSILDSIERIACAKVVPPELRADAMQLSSWLCSYIRQWGPPDHDRGQPPQQILARCLAVAPLGSLRSELKKMHEHRVRVGSNHAYFVSVFAQRLKGILPNVLSEGLRRFGMRRVKRPQADLDFSTQIAADAFRKVRQIG